MSDRGEYRSIRTVLIDGPDFQRLTPAARLTFLCVKLNLGPWGIAVFRGAVSALAEQTGYDEPQVSRALAELEAAGWIRRDRNVVWVVNGVTHEPAFSHRDEKHRKALHAHLATLPRLPIVMAFVEHHPEWFPNGINGDAPTRPIARPLEGPSKAPGSTEDDDEDRRQNYPTPSSARARDELGHHVTERLNSASAKRFLAVADAALRGLNTPLLTDQQLAHAIDDFIANGEPPNLARFRGYLRRAATERSPPAGPNGGSHRPRGGVARRTFESTTTALEGL